MMKGIIETRILKIPDNIIKLDNLRELFSDIESEIDRLQLETFKVLIQDLNKAIKYSGGEKLSKSDEIVWIDFF